MSDKEQIALEMIVAMDRLLDIHKPTGVVPPSLRTIHVTFYTALMESKKASDRILAKGDNVKRTHAIAMAEFDMQIMSQIAIAVNQWCNGITPGTLPDTKQYMALNTQIADLGTYYPSAMRVFEKDPEDFCTQFHKAGYKAFKANGPDQGQSTSISA